MISLNLLLYVLGRAGQGEAVGGCVRMFLFCFPFIFNVSL